MRLHPIYCATTYTDGECKTQPGYLFVFFCVWLDLYLIIICCVARAMFCVKGVSRQSLVCSNACRPIFNQSRAIGNRCNRGKTQIWPFNTHIKIQLHERAQHISISSMRQSWRHRTHIKPTHDTSQAIASENEIAAQLNTAFGVRNPLKWKAVMCVVCFFLSVVHSRPCRTTPKRMMTLWTSIRYI